RRWCFDDPSRLLSARIECYISETRHANTALKNDSGIFQYLLDRSIAGENATQAVLPQRYHPELDRLLLENNGRSAFVDQFAQRIGDLHQFINSFSPFVADVVAAVAALAAEK